MNKKSEKLTLFLNDGTKDRISKILGVPYHLLMGTNVSEFVREAILDKLALEEKDDMLCYFVLNRLLNQVEREHGKAATVEMVQRWLGPSLWKYHSKVKDLSRS